MYLGLAIVYTVFPLTDGIINILVSRGTVGRNNALNFIGYSWIVIVLLLVNLILDCIFSDKEERKNRRKKRTKTEKIILLIMALIVVFDIISIYCERR